MACYTRPHVRHDVQERQASWMQDRGRITTSKAGNGMCRGTEIMNEDLHGLLYIAPPTVMREGSPKLL